METLPIRLMTRAEFNAFRTERAKEAVQAKAGRGVHTGRTPLGYRLEYDRLGDGTIVTDEAVAPLVREAFMLMAAGGFTVRRLAKTISEKGLVSTQGKPMSRQALRFVMSNPFYYGVIRHKGAAYQGKHEPLVSAELFTRVQTRL